MDYKETTVAGSAWRRFSRIVIENDRLQTPTIICVEQEVIALAAGEVLRDVANLNFRFDPGDTFAVLDPDTNAPTGVEATGAQVYALVYSYVMAQAIKRDAAQATLAAVEREPGLSAMEESGLGAPANRP